MVVQGRRVEAVEGKVRCRIQAPHVSCKLDAEAGGGVHRYRDRDQARFPLSLGLFGIRAEMSSGGAGDFTLLMAGNVMMTLPVILIFLIFQKYFVQGMTMSGMKG